MSGFNEKIIFCAYSDITSYLKNYKNILIVGNFIKAIPGALSVSIPDGEAAKTLDVVKILWDVFERYKVDKSWIIVSMGGGSASDVVGYAASNFKRGIDFASIPTTLLSMIDACIGYKRAINYNGTKNLIGSFYPAKMIFVDTSLLESLNRQEKQNGYAEAIKISLISGFELSNNVEDLINQCIKAKQQIVESDPFENNGKRFVLNYGHTLGHAIESFFDFRVSHGISIAVGMDFACFFSQNLKFKKIQDEAFKRFEIFDEVKKIKSMLSKNDVEHLIRAIDMDKKKNQDNINFVILKDKGNAFVRKTKIDEIKDSLLEYFN